MLIVNVLLTSLWIQQNHHYESASLCSCYKLAASYTLPWILDNVTLVFQFPCTSKMIHLSFNWGCVSGKLRPVACGSQTASYDSFSLRLTYIYDILVKFRYGIDTKYVATLLPLCHVTLGKFPNISEPQFLIGKWE